MEGQKHIDRQVVHLSHALLAMQQAAPEEPHWIWYDDVSHCPHHNNHVKDYSKSSQTVFLIEQDWRWFLIGSRVTTWMVFGHISESCLQRCVIPLSMAYQHHVLTISRYSQCSYSVFGFQCVRTHADSRASVIPGTSYCQLVVGALCARPVSQIFTVGESLKALGAMSCDTSGFLHLPMPCCI